MDRVIAIVSYKKLNQIHFYHIFLKQSTSFNNQKDARSMPLQDLWKLWCYSFIAIGGGRRGEEERLMKSLKNIFETARRRLD